MQPQEEGVLRLILEVRPEIIADERGVDDSDIDSVLLATATGRRRGLTRARSRRCSRSRTPPTSAAPEAAQ
ncbi:MAG: hypothetical protein WKH64_12150 [Chloroflexia bacterium]